MNANFYDAWEEAVGSLRRCYLVSNLHAPCAEQSRLREAIEALGVQSRQAAGSKLGLRMLRLLAGESAQRCRELLDLHFTWVNCWPEIDDDADLTGGILESGDGIEIVDVDDEGGIVRSESANEFAMKLDSLRPVQR